MSFQTNVLNTNFGNLWLLKQDIYVFFALEPTSRIRVRGHAATRRRWIHCCVRRIAHDFCHRRIFWTTIIRRCGGRHFDVVISFVTRREIFFLTYFALVRIFSSPFRTLTSVSGGVIRIQFRIFASFVIAKFNRGVMITIFFRFSTTATSCSIWIVIIIVQRFATIARSRWRIVKTHGRG